MIFADTLFTPTNDMIAIGAVFVIAAAAAHGANEIMKFVDRFRTKPPVDEQVSDLKDWIELHFATKSELQHAKELFATTLVNQDTRITQMRVEVSALGELIRENEARHEERSIALHNRINPILEVIGELRGRVKSHSQSLRGAHGGS